MKPKSKKTVMPSKRSKRHVHENESMYREIFDSATDAIFVYDTVSGRIVDVNKAALRMYGWRSKKNILARKVAGLIVCEPPFTKTEAARRLRLAASGKQQVFEWLARKRNGKTFWVEISLRSSRVGGRKRILAVMHDINERKQTEEVLRQRSEGLATVLEVSKDFVATLNLEAVLQTATNRVTELTQLKSAAVYLLEGETLRLWATTPPLPLQFPEELRNSPLSDHPHIRKTIMTGKPVIIRDATTADLTPAERSVTELRGLRSVMYLPLIAGSNVMGTLIAASVGEPRVFTESEVTLCSTLSNVAAVALQNTLLYESSQRSVSELERQILKTKSVEERQASILRTLPLILYAAETPSPFDATWLSENASRVTGFSPESFVQQKGFWSSRIHPDDKERADAALAVIRQGREIEVEYRWLCSDGTYRWFLDRATFVRQTTDGRVEYSGIWLDISERKQTEEALRESEGQYRLLVEAARIGIGVADLEGNVLICNEAMLEQSGYTRDDLNRGFNVTALYSDVAQRQHALSLLQQHGGVHQIPVQFKRKDGSSFDTLLSLNRIQFRGKPCVQALVEDITDRKRAEEALRLSQATYIGILNSITEAVYVQDEHGMFLDVNHAAEVMYGYPRELFVGQTPLFLSAPGKNDLGAVAEMVTKAFNGMAQHFEFWGMSKDGTVFPKDVNLTAGTYFGKRVVLAVSRDISERKRAEEELRKLSQKDGEALYIAHMGHWEFDVSTAQFTFNDQYYSLHGTTAEEAGGYLMSAEKFASRYVHPDDAHIVGKHIEQAIETNDPNFHLQAEARILRANGESRDVTVWFRVEKDPQGRTTKLIGVNQDITERKRAEEALRQSEGRLRAIIEAEPECVKILSLEGAVVEMNQAGIAMLEAKSLEEVRQQNLIDYVVPSHREDFDKYFRDTLRGPTGRTLEYEIVGLKGTHRWLETNAVPLLDDDRQVTAVLGITRDITVRKRAEEVLKRYQLLSQNTHDIMLFLRSSDGQILEANNAAVQAYGYDREKLMTMRIHDLRAPETLDDLPKQLEEANRAGVSFETFHRRRDGTTFPVEVSSRGMTVEAEHVLLSIIRDASERKKAESALKESESKYRALVDSSPDAIAIYVGGKIVFANAMSLQLMRANNVNQLIGKSVIEFVHPDDRSFVAKRMMEAMKSGKPLPSAEERFVRVDGTVVDVEVKSMSVVFDGKPGVQIVVRDITERKRAQETLRKSEAQYRYLFETMPDGVYRSTHDGKFLEVNPAMVRILGYDNKEELLAIDIKSQLYFAEEERVSAALEEKNEEMAVFRLRKKDGSEVWVEDHGRHVVDEQGNILYHEGILRDITERKRMDEDRVKIEQQMQQTQKLESLGLLAGGIAHDFNNLLSGIFGYVELAKKSVDDGDTRKTTERLLKAMTVFTRAKDLTKQLLTFSKGGAPAKIPGDIAKTLSETVQFALSGSNVKGEYSIAADLWSCGYDPNQIAQVIDNIVINAKHAMPNGGLLEVSASNALIESGSGIALPNGPYIKIALKDCGIGIPEQYLQKIFDPFFTTKQTGSGLGLTTCWSIVKRHDGIMRVESQPGKGSTFFVYLPAIPDAVSVGSTISAENFMGHGKILVMDDEEHIREILEDMLKDIGYAVQTAGHGAEAIELYLDARAEGNPFDLVLVDLTIPGGMGGKETLAKLIELDKTVRVIASSGYSEDPVMSAPRDYGFVASIRKPYRKEDLVSALMKALAGRKV